MTSSICHHYLVVYSESYYLGEERSREPGRHQQPVPQGTLVETLADHTTGKLVVSKRNPSWVLVVGMNLGHKREARRGRGRVTTIIILL